MKRALVLMATGLIGLVSFLFLFSLWPEYQVEPDRFSVRATLVGAAAPAAAFLLLAEKLGWTKVREVGSDRMFKPGE